MFYGDVNGRVTAEEPLRESEARFRGVFDSRVSGFTVFDANTGETLAANDRFLAMIGQSRLDFEEGRWEWRQFTPDKYFPLDEAAIATKPYPSRRSQLTAMNLPTAQPRFRTFSG